VGTPWHIGDFGRYEIESPKFPRFEVISATKTEVQVWYSGQTTLTTIPKRTFLDDCVKWWLVEPIEKLFPFPKWLYEGGSFSLESPIMGINVTLTQIPDRATPGFPTKTHTNHEMDLKGRLLTYRRKQGDYISCLTGDPQCLVLVPIKVILKFGRSVKTRWDFLRTTDIVDPDEDDF
jgi:hypothetical protein